MTPAFETHDLTKRYGFRGPWGLRGLTVSVEPGRIVGLLGANAVGKSTLIKLLAGLLRPTSGTVSVLGQQPGLETKRRVAYLPEIDHLFPEFDSQRMTRFMATFFEDFDTGRAENLLEALAVPRDQPFKSQSRGQRGRFKLAMTLARNAQLFLLDEPLAGIDLVSRERILRTILTEYRQGEQTVLLATHEIAEAEALFERVIFIKNGQTLLAGSADDLRAQRGMSIADIFRAEFSE
jgi:ABC-2 type transport system ATP-binding protein